MKAKRVEFYLDLVSPFSYVARGRVEERCEEHGAELVLRPMLLQGVFEASGNQRPGSVPAKGATWQGTCSGGPSAKGCRCASRNRSPSVR